MKYIYKNNYVYLKNITHLVYETLSGYQNLWINLIKPINPPSESRYEGEELVGIQRKGNIFLSELYALSKENDAKKLDMYEIGKTLEFDEFETELIVENLADAELIRHEKNSDKVAITPYGIMTMKGELPVGYAPIH